ncbi:hypothetical protein HD806DRAFT_488733 [Xylariaceae sp. AK1471]|nr:hypothetical protein HD806DRAFT_488733 [Xylariaceae sp. AK1471]
MCYGPHSFHTWWHCGRLLSSRRLLCSSYFFLLRFIAAMRSPFLSHIVPCNNKCKRHKVNRSLRRASIIQTVSTSVGEGLPTIISPTHPTYIIYFHLLLSWVVSVLSARLQFRPEKYVLL